MIRPLCAAGLLRVEGGNVKATKAGRTADADVVRIRGSDDSPAKLSAGQEDLLRLILRHPGMATDEVDKRTLRSLLARGLVHEADGRLSAVPDAAAALLSRRSTPTRPNRGRPGRRNHRAEAMLNAIEQLERAFPSEAEILVGSIMCAATDLTDALRKYARQLSTRRTGVES